MTSTLRIALLWHSTRSANLGVGALTVANIALAREAAAAVGLTPQFTIYGPREAGDPYVVGDDIAEAALDGRMLASPGGYWAAIGKADVVLDIGAGDSWADIYGKKRFAYLWATKMAAIARGKPLVFSPQTIGPFSPGPLKSLAAIAQGRATAIVARDPQSFAVARAMTPKARVLEAVDVAFALPFDRPLRNPAAAPRVGINVSGLLFNGGYKGGNDYGLDVDYAALSRALIEALLAEGVTVELITHVNAPHIPRDDDGAVADQLALEFPGVLRVPDFASPSAAKSHIAGLDFLVAGRMHACIAAFSSGVAVVPVAYSRKFSGLFEGVLGYKHLVPVKGLSTADALAFILDRYRRRDELAADIALANIGVRERLDRYVALLTELFGRVRANG
ncbi:Polysaccharide pyruvyl transferase domain-containing protein [Sphingomonas antarctica]|uniref:polysaccharide pyruvyl transferase family protein n=1 Tax=Sphingomonas antarctica TaxID=2040274 RepID=UPI0039E85366